MKLTFYGGVKIVTGSNYLLEAAGKKILVDCGMVQGTRYAEEKNYEPFPYDPKEIDFVFVTHAHLDHTGRLPKLFCEGFRGKIFATPPTKDLAELILLDTENILVKEAMRDNHNPLYTNDDVWGVMRLFETVGYHEPIHPAEGITVTFSNAGHILGSSSILIEAEGKKILFSGDVGNFPELILDVPDSLPPVDFLVVESAYGDRIHTYAQNRQEILEDIVEDAIKSGGTLMIPAFALERTQELLYELHDLIANNRIPEAPIFLDSPLAIKATEIYKKYPEYLNKEAEKMLMQKKELFDFPRLTKILTKEESKEINSVPPPKIVIAGSGMSHGGRILHHESRYLPDPKSTLLVVGYQAKGSMGRRIIDGAKEVEIFGQKVEVNCKVKVMTEYSAHADQNQILAWVEPIHQVLKKVFVVQGEAEASEALAGVIRDRLAIDAAAPEPESGVDLA